ncbi:hypothetical protein [Geoalkalibacter sp.]|uniref:hypothetical protein n=1 Tax=Geoalkalibacter sp. TaxID=3041440 RepID=UPI00272EB440|nr:hypothetical protein [Geoalkalibacter sp.]
MDRVNAGSTYMIDLEFRDLVGQPVVPYEVNYSVFDVPTGTVLREPTPLAVGGSAHALELTPEDTDLVSQENEEEYRGVVVFFKHGQNKQASGQHRFVVRRVGGWIG